jgi:hypothetical protein
VPDWKNTCETTHDVLEAVTEAVEAVCEMIPPATPDVIPPIVPPEWPPAVLSVARDEVGNTETAPDCTKYNAWYGEAAGTSWQHQPWCGMFVSWVYAHALYPLPAMQAPGYSGFAKAQIGLDYCKMAGWLVPAPRPGDLVFFDWTGDGHFDHVGIVVEVGTDSFTSIEGNTGTPSVSVMEHTHPITSRTLFAHPQLDGPCWKVRPYECPV